MNALEYDFIRMLAVVPAPIDSYRIAAMELLHKLLLGAFLAKKSVSSLAELADKLNMFATMEHFERMLDFHLLTYTVVTRTAFGPTRIFAGEKTSIIYMISIYCNTTLKQKSIR